MPRPRIPSRSSGVVFGLALLLAPPVATHAQDVAGSSDHPLVSRFQGSRIVKYRSSDFDQYRLVTKPINGYRSGIRAEPVAAVIDGRNSRPVEGRLTMITYEAPQNSTTLEILRSYERALKGARLEAIFQCAGRECAGKAPPPACRLCGDYLNTFAKGIMHRAGMNLSGPVYEGQRYLAGRLHGPDGDVYVSLLVLNLKKPLTQLDIVEVKPMEEDLVTADAAAMARDINAKGSVSVYGIYFDTDRADLKPASGPVLMQIGELLRQQPDLRLFVVGHTDNTGTVERNRALSEARARAVVDALVAHYGVDARRLSPWGVGPLAPVASNATEQGRARNRRVELVAR